MDELVELSHVPVADEIYMIVGWRQWADAGAISSGLPEYLIKWTSATKIGEIKPDGFYLFQVPGTHHLLRPEIKLEDGYRKELRVKKNEFFYTGDEHKGLVIPIEVKSGASGRLRSLHSFIDRAAHSTAVRIYGGEFSVDRVETIAKKPYTLIKLSEAIYRVLND